MQCTTKALVQPMYIEAQVYQCRYYRKWTLINYCRLNDNKNKFTPSLLDDLDARKILAVSLRPLDVENGSDEEVDVLVQFVNVVFICKNQQKLFNMQINWIPQIGISLKLIILFEL